MKDTVSLIILQILKRYNKKMFNLDKIDKTKVILKN